MLASLYPLTISKTSCIIPLAQWQISCGCPSALGQRYHNHVVVISIGCLTLVIGPAMDSRIEGTSALGHVHAL